MNVGGALFFLFLFSYQEACLKSLLCVSERLLEICHELVWCAVCLFICGLVFVCVCVEGGACVVCVCGVRVVCATVAVTTDDLAVAVDLGLTDAAQAAQMSTELQRLQQLRERQVNADVLLYSFLSAAERKTGECGRSAVFFSISS